MQIRFLRLIDELFQGVPQTRETLEMKEEIVQNLMEKYNDLRAEGKTEEEAFLVAAASVGDINELIGGAAGPTVEATQPPAYSSENGTENPQNVMSWLQVIAVFLALIILCPFAVRLFQDWRGIFLAVVMPLGAFGLLIYQIVSTIRLRRSAAFDDHEFHEEENAHEWAPAVNNRKLYRSLNGALWPIAVAAYFLISFGGGGWHLTWIIFLITPAISVLLKASLGLIPFRRAFTAAFWLTVNVLYFVISFATHKWAVTWIIYLIAASLHNVIKASFELKKGR